MKKLKSLIEKERNLAHTEGTDGSFHTMEEFNILRAKKELCEKFLKFIESENKCIHPLPLSCEANEEGIRNDPKGKEECRKALKEEGLLE